MYNEPRTYLSQSHPKCWLSGACSDFDLGFCWEIPQLFVVWGLRHLFSIFNQTLRAFTDIFGLDFVTAVYQLPYTFVIHQRKLCFFILFTPLTLSLGNPQNISLFLGCLINFVMFVRSVRKLQPICKEYRTTKKLKPKCSFKAIRIRVETMVNEL